MQEEKHTAETLLVEAEQLLYSARNDISHKDFLRVMDAVQALQNLRAGQRVPMWHPIETAPKDNARPLALAQFGDDGNLQDLDWDVKWKYFRDSYGEGGEYDWESALARCDTPTHWAYQDEPLPPLTLGNVDRRAATGIRKTGEI